jgi:CheY-like chemotaxis protein
LYFMATILIVDDNEQIRELLSSILKAEGHSVITADNGADGILAARKSLPALVLSDIKMPRKTGIELCKALKSDEKTKRIPIIMLSSAGQMKEIEEALANGAGSYITKPSDRAHILESVRAALNQKAPPSWLHSKRGE